MNNIQRIYVTPGRTEAAQTAPSADMPQKPLMAIIDLDRYIYQKEIIEAVVAAIKPEYVMYVSAEKKPDWVSEKEFHRSGIYKKLGKQTSGSDFDALMLVMSFKTIHDIVLISQDIDWLYIAKITNSKIVYLDKTNFGNELEYSVDMEVSPLSTSSSKLLKLADLCK